MTHYMGIICSSFTWIATNSSRIFQKIFSSFLWVPWHFFSFPILQGWFFYLFLKRSVFLLSHSSRSSGGFAIFAIRPHRVQAFAMRLLCELYSITNAHEQVVSDCKSWYLGHWDFLDSSGKSGKSRWTTLIVQRPQAPSNLRWGVPFGSRQVWLGDAIYRRLYHAAPPFL